MTPPEKRCTPLIEQESITPAEGSRLWPWAWRTWVVQLGEVAVSGAVAGPA